MQPGGKSQENHRYYPHINLTTNQHQCLPPPDVLLNRKNYPSVFRRLWLEQPNTFLTDTSSKESMLCYCSTNQMFTWLLIADEIQSPLSLFGTLVSVTSPFLPASCSQHENLCSGQNGLPNSESFLRAKTRAHAYFSRSPVTTSRLLGMSWEKITAHLTEQSFGSSPPTPSFNWTAKTRGGNRTCSGLHTEVLIDPELEQQAAGSSMSIFFRKPTK